MKLKMVKKKEVEDGRTKDKTVTKVAEPGAESKSEKKKRRSHQQPLHLGGVARRIRRWK